MSLYECEHCGTKVPATRVCPQCGRDHSDSWFQSINASKFVEGIFSLLVLVFIGILVIRDVYFR